MAQLMRLQSRYHHGCFLAMKVPCYSDHVIRLGGRLLNAHRARLPLPAGFVIGARGDLWRAHWSPCR